MSQILIIDDDRTIQEGLARKLRKQGYTVEVAVNGEEGLEKAIKLHPSLIICDWTMPKMDGLEVCRHVKQLPELANSYFILLTARGKVGDIVEGLENGADDFLSKPPNISELKARVRAGLRLHQANQELQDQKQLLEKELAKAAEYVRSLIPLPLISESIKTEACFLPSTQLGGDCFDYFWLDSDHFAMYLLDVSGHGVGSALLSVSILNLLRTRSLRDKSEQQAAIDFLHPASVLSALNDYFQMSEHQDMYFTIWYGVFECSTRQLVYASGGHPPAILLVPEQDQQIKIDNLHTFGLPLGMMPGADYEVAKCEVPVGSRLYLYSDGAYEISQPDQSIWGMEKFVEVLLSAFRPNSKSQKSGVPEIITQIKNNLIPGQGFEDDISLLEISFN